MSARAAFVFDAERCTACEACRVACGIENGGGRDTGWRQVLTLNPARHPALPTRHLSLACNHCDTPACLRACPARAYRRDAATGAVLIDGDKCIGCRYCSWVCPYDAPRFDEAAGVMTKCTFCSPRVAAGGQPACTQACPTGALAFGTRAAGAAEPRGVGLGASGLGPALVLVEPRRAPSVPVAPPPVRASAPPVQPRPARKIEVRSEWGLLVFTLVLPLLAAWIGAGAMWPERRPPLGVFLVAAGGAMALSALHLGRPRRAWRAVLNVRTSWLSREIALANLFVGLGALHLMRPAWVAGWAALLAGGALCVAIDGVYRAVPRAEARRRHSAEAVPTFVLLFALAAGVSWLGLAAALVKTWLFARRWHAGRLGLPRELGALRLALLAAALVTAAAWALALAAAVLGEALDRFAFYTDLEPATPAGQMVTDALHWSRAA